VAASTLITAHYIGQGMVKQCSLPPNLAPRLINRTVAAAYVSVSPVTFDSMVAAGIMPKPKLLTGSRKAWDVRQLDLAIDGLPSEDDNSPQTDNSWSDMDA
jgi:hypothetical protein